MQKQVLASHWALDWDDCTEDDEFFPAKWSNEILTLISCVWTEIFMEHNDSFTQYVKPFVLNWMAQFLYVAEFIVSSWGKKSTSVVPFLSQNEVYMIFQAEIICFNINFLGDI